MQDFALGQIAGIEHVIDICIADMRLALSAFQRHMKTWPEKDSHTWGDKAKVNALGLKLFETTLLVHTLILRFSQETTVPDYTPVLVDIQDIYETLSSWDLYRSFGWKE